MQYLNQGLFIAPFLPPPLQDIYRPSSTLSQHAHFLPPLPVFCKTRKMQMHGFKVCRRSHIKATAIKYYTANITKQIAIYIYPLRNIMFEIGLRYSAGLNYC